MDVPGRPGLVRNPLHACFERVDNDIRELRQELRFEIGSLRTTMTRVGGGIMVGLVGVIAAIGANGI